MSEELKHSTHSKTIKHALLTRPISNSYFYSAILIKNLKMQMFYLLRNSSIKSVVVRQGGLALPLNLFI